MTANDKREESGFYKWRLLILLAVTYFLMHATRQIFNASLPQIKADLPGTTDAEWGFTRTAFLFAYGLAVPVAGIAADMFRRKWVVVLGALLFSVSVFFTGWVDSFLGMLIMYGLLNGVGQCMIPASSSSLIAQYHRETRSTALSIYQTGLYFGIIVSSVAAGWIGSVSSGGWRWAFWIFGAVGVAWSAALVACLRDTPPLMQSHRAAEFERASLKEACLAMVSKPTALCLTFAFGMLVFGSNCFRTFMPLFLQEGVGKGGFALSPTAAAFHAVFWFYVGSFLGIAFGARTSDRLSKRRPGIRIEMMMIGMFLSAPAMAAMVYMPNLALACAVMFVFGVGGGFFDCNLYAGLFDVVAPRYRAAAMGVYLCGAFLIGCPATAVLGYVGQHFSYRCGIAVFGVTYLIGALAILLARLLFFARDRARTEAA